VIITHAEEKFIDHCVKKLPLIPLPVIALTSKKTPNAKTSKSAIIRYL
jgi:hypothetical protein